MRTGYYADPTAWAAIARCEARPVKACQQVTGKLNRPRIGTYHAPGAKTKDDRKYVVYRQENRRSTILLAMQKAMAGERFGEVNGE